MVRNTFILSTLAALGCISMVLAQKPQTLEANVNTSGIKATFTFEPIDDSGDGAKVTINVVEGLTKKFAVLPKIGFEYHIHVKPAGPNNDCMATGGHLDPTNVGNAVCDPKTPEKCQEGDLSGKHGNLMPTEDGSIPEFSYVDKFIHFTGEASTITGRSVVIHNNGTKIACADILPQGESGSDSQRQSSITAGDSHTNGASADGRLSGNAVWMAMGTVGSGLMAGMMAL
ncbi:hypothetical protein BG011_006924 [Mortierella polycephala]|uniref:Superoxide dismutase copper/zinc binding domain-containing protein n=1 Tax=Mortierella polycephala TaxID=41804 RepID=A0A9P6TZB6_9FUNG|nr:hypothetical protein BG011_006924 [Mortierella polycephala]